jgi:uncharacterized protein YdeI (BOF family)
MEVFMKRVGTFLITAFLLVTTVLLVTGCAAEKYGADINKSAPLVKVKDVILNPSLQGQTVNLEGIITTQCQGDGCWFFLNDGTGQIFINLKPAGITIPPKTGKKAKVTGVVVNDSGNYLIIAHGVEIN